MNKKSLSAKLKENKISEKLINDALQILQQCETGMFTNTSIMKNKDELLQKTRKVLEEINNLLSSF
jgi:pyruvate/oxaloacetate carboxyltransferase